MCGSEFALWGPLDSFVSLLSHCAHPPSLCCFSFSYHQLHIFNFCFLSLPFIPFQFFLLQIRPESTSFLDQTTLVIHLYWGQSEGYILLLSREFLGGFTKCVSRQSIYFGRHVLLRRPKYIKYFKNLLISFCGTTEGQTTLLLQIFHNPHHTY